MPCSSFPTLRLFPGRRVVCSLFGCMMIVLGSGCQPGVPATADLTPVVLQLSWTHQAQFAGFYAAEQNGYYAAEDLHVTFREGGPSLSPWEVVAAGEADFGVTSGEQLVLARAEGNPLTALATILRRSPRVFVALAESGISRPQDFAGRVISIGRGGRPLLEAMMKNVGVGPEEYQVVESSPDLTPFLEGEVDVRYVFLTNEAITLRQAGHDLNLITPDDYGIHFYADTLFVRDDLLSENPDLVLRLVRASLRGWTWAVENPEAAGSLVKLYWPEADAALEGAKMTASIPLVNTGEDYIGWMKPEVWSGMETTLRQQGVLSASLDIGTVYTLEFLEAIYGK